MSSQQELSELFSSPFIESFNWDEKWSLKKLPFQKVYLLIGFISYAFIQSLSVLGAKHLQADHDPLKLEV